MSYRGPDASGLFVSDDKKIALGHRRLSIIDLSKNGIQPMRIGDYIIIFNGEVYNFQELKKGLPGDYISTSDTEVILRAYMKYGLDAFSRLDGMFALVIYDIPKNRIVLARDRMGIKPIYYYQNNDIFCFGSELKTITAPKKLNLRAVQKFLYQNYIYGDETIIADIFKLPSGSFGVYDLAAKNFKITAYWKPDFKPKQDTSFDPIKSCHDILRDSVKRSLISDVPLGVFLSSGTDSSLITALAKEITPEVKTFTVGFEFNSFDESKNAEKISKILGTEHSSIYISKNEITDNIEKIIDVFDEPFGDSSAINTYFLTKFAKEKVKVCLSGDGADEIFAGYPIYYLPKFSNIYNRLPNKQAIEMLTEFIPTSFDRMSFDYKLRRFVHAAKYDFTKAHFYYRIMHNEGVFRKEESDFEPDDFQVYFEEVLSENVLNRLLYTDQKTVLEGDYLVKVDRTSMANSLEVRVPFLNNDVVGFANKLDPQYKLHYLQTKYILKKVLENYIPKRLIYQKKQGFSFPMADWLCGELKDLMLDSLGPVQIQKFSFLNNDKIQEMIKSHLEKKWDYNRELWGLINLLFYLNKI